MDFNIYKPLRDNVVIEIKDMYSKSGIIMSNNELSEEATVMAVGEDVKSVKVGDKVIYNQFAGTLINKDKHARIMKEEDLLVKVER